MIESLAIVGATGAVGREACGIIGQRAIDVGTLKLLSSGRSAGTEVDLAGSRRTVELLTETSFDGVNYAVFSAGSDTSRRFAPIAAAAGCVVIDNSSAFRMDDGTPLVVPEINPDDARSHRGIIANPNCTTIIMVMAVAPLNRVNPVRRIIVSTYQSASGAGVAAMEELRTQTTEVLAGREPEPKVFPHPIAFNLFVHNSPLDADGYNTEEVKMVNEARKILHEPDLAVTATCVRVPVTRAHSESVNLTFERPIRPAEVREILQAAPGIELVDDFLPSRDREGAGSMPPDLPRFPMPIDATGRDACLVGHIRQDRSRPDERGINLFVCGDQLRKGAALNAIQIVELLAG